MGLKEQMAVPSSEKNPGPTKPQFTPTIRQNRGEHKDWDGEDCFDANGDLIPCEGQHDNMEPPNVWTCFEGCEEVGMGPCCWYGGGGNSVYDPDTGRYLRTLNGEIIYGVYECVANGPNDEQICEWVFYTQKGDQLIVPDGSGGFVRRIKGLQPNFDPFYYYEVDSDGDGIADYACGFYYNPLTAQFIFGCQWIF